MSAVEKIVQLGEKLPGAREWRHTFPIVLALFCSGLAGLIALAISTLTCVEISVSALMTCVGMVAFTSVLMFPSKRRRFYALAGQLKSAAEAALELDFTSPDDVEGDEWPRFLQQLVAVEAELYAAGLLPPPVRVNTTGGERSMSQKQFDVWEPLLTQLHVFARERRYAKAVNACRKACLAFEAATGEPAHP